MGNLRTPENQEKHERICVAFFTFMRLRKGTSNVSAVSPDMIIEWLLERAVHCGRASRAPLVQQLRAILDTSAAGGHQSSPDQWMAPASLSALRSAIATELDLSRGRAAWDPVMLTGNPARSVQVDHFIEAYRKFRVRAGHGPMPAEEVTLDSISRLVGALRQRTSGSMPPRPSDVRDAQTVAAVCCMYALGDRPVDVTRMRFELIQELDPSGFDFKVFTVGDKGALLSARSDVVKVRKLLQNEAVPEICPVRALLDLQLAYETFGVPNPRSGFVFKALTYGSKNEISQLPRDVLTKRFKAAAHAAGLPQLVPAGVRRGSAQDYAEIALPDQTISVSDIMRHGRWLGADTARLYLRSVAHNWRS